jgi:plastocyanin/mono/diheme cytochrome c family protein
MNTRKQVLIMTTLLLMMLITVGVYAAWYPSRAEDAEEFFDEATSERGAILFARNCRLCHGDVGEGGALGQRLPAALPLNTPRLQGFEPTDATLEGGLNASATTVPLSDGGEFEGGDLILIDSERMQVKAVDGNELTVVRGIENTAAAQHFEDAPVYLFNEAAFDLLNPDSVINVIRNTIACGRVGTAMPAWAQVHGGPLSDEQIRQLQTMISNARWDMVKHEVDIEDRVEARLTQPLSADTTSMHVDDVSVFTEDEAIRIGEERIRLTSVPILPVDLRGALPADKSGVMSVERGVLATTPLAHPVESIIYRFPVAPEPSINESSCGQTAQAPAPAGMPELIEDFTGQTVEVIANLVAFNVREIRVNADGQVRVRFDNQETVQHNIAFYESSTDITPVSPGSVGITFAGPAMDDTVFAIPAAGTYHFRCDVHPTIMTGSFIVQ